jgi:hypothetical protein
MRYEFVEEVQRELARQIPRDIASFMPQLVDVLRDAIRVVYTRFRERQNIGTNSRFPKHDTPLISDESDMFPEEDFLDFNASGFGDSILDGDFMQQILSPDLGHQGIDGLFPHDLPQF